ncbi:hypothetical protein PM082_010085 [Marasmius tenuissimus]|nr:hypothetical protein PM082_010085 [Marasmius tenuissimus]
MASHLLSKTSSGVTLYDRFQLSSKQNENSRCCVCACSLYHRRAPPLKLTADQAVAIILPSPCSTSEIWVQ